MVGRSLGNPLDRVTEALRDELLKGEILYTLQEAQMIIENWRRHYNTVRPHSSLVYRPTTPEVLVPISKLALTRTLNWTYTRITILCHVVHRKEYPKFLCTSEM